jgi:DNA-binding transcriptional regulator YdaS (Cro superfamily)
MPTQARKNGTLRAGTRQIAALRRAVSLIGSQAKLARVVKRAQPSVWFILTHKSRCPADWCLAIEHATQGRVTAHELRPDLYPKKGKYIPPRPERIAPA